MVKSKLKKLKEKRNLGVLITTIVFMIVAIALIVIGFYSDIVSWLTKFGIVLLVIAFPVSVWVIYQILKSKIEEM